MGSSGPITYMELTHMVSSMKAAHPPYSSVIKHKPALLTSSLRLEPLSPSKTSVQSLVTGTCKLKILQWMH